jgi:hypothetical protein
MGDVVLYKNYTSTLKCIESNSEAYLMKRKDFLRLFKTNEEAWRLMFIHAKQNEIRTLKACNNFIGVCNKAKVRRE